MNINNLAVALFSIAVVAAFPALAADHAGHGKSGAAALTTAPMDREKLWKKALDKPSFAVTASFDENGSGVSSYLR